MMAGACSARTTPEAFQSPPAPAGLLTAWQTLGASLDRDTQSWRAEGARLLRSWQRWPRAYHDQRHLTACIGQWQRLQQERPGSMQNPQAVALALWFHDAIYWPWRRDNEARSAAWAQRFLTAQALPAALTHTVVQHIMDTRHAASASSGDGQWVVDMDLSILGQDEIVFRRYERHVRQEYFFVRRSRYIAGRRAVLLGFLDQPRIYQTDWFHQRLEAQARSNLAQSVHALEQGQLWI